MGEGREVSISRAESSTKGLGTVGGVIRGSRVVPTLRLLPLVLGSDNEVLDSDCWSVTKSNPAGDGRRLTDPTRERKDGLKERDGEGLAIVVQYSREGESEKRLSTLALINSVPGDLGEAIQQRNGRHRASCVDAGGVPLQLERYSVKN